MKTAPVIPIATALLSLVLAILPGAPVSGDFVTFSNTNAIAIVDNGFTTPIPTIAVGPIPFVPLRVTVSVHGVSHTYINDVALAVVSPQGVKVLLVSGTGPEGGEPGPFDVSDQTWTFDDLAAQQMPQSVVPVSGTYKPGMRLDDYFDDFPGFGTAETFDTNFSRLTGIDPTGTWSLLVRDSQRLDRGTISRGWSISFDNITAVPEPSGLTLGSIVLLAAAARRMWNRYPICG